jgi:hypothetical protein
VRSAIGRSARARYLPVSVKAVSLGLSPGAVRVLPTDAVGSHAETPTVAVELVEPVSGVAGAARAEERRHERQLDEEHSEPHAIDGKRDGNVEENG